MREKGSETFVDGLATALRTERDHNMRRYAAAIALARIGEPAVPALLERAGSGEKNALEHALVGLKQVRSRASTLPLVSIARAAPPEQRRMVADALGQIRDPRAVSGLSEPSEPGRRWSRSRVIALLGSEDPFERRTGADLLRHHRSPEGAAALSDKDIEVRRAAARSLALVDDCFFGGCPSLEPLIEALGADDGELRRTAETSLEALTRRRLGAEPERWRAALPRLRPTLQ